MSILVTVRVLTLLLAVLVGSSSAEVSGTLAAGTCVCATAGLNGRDQASTAGAIVDGLTAGECVKSSGGQADADGYTWYKVNHLGQTMYAAGKYLNKEAASSCSGSSSTGCPIIVSRREWDARTPTKRSYLALPVPYVFIHHTDGATCNTRADCIRRAQDIQDYHMFTNQWSDVGYNFLVGGDGALYEGRGWDRIGSHTYGYNGQGIAFSFMGNFMKQTPTQAALDAVQQAIACGVSKGKIDPNYTLRGHRDMMATACPGDQLHAIIKKWDHF